jgi:hypothetical protein
MTQAASYSPYPFTKAIAFDFLLILSYSVGLAALIEWLAARAPERRRPHSTPASLRTGIARSYRREPRGRERRTRRRRAGAEPS